MIKKSIIMMTLTVTFISISLTGCDATKHAMATQKALEGDRLTVGTVQKEIKKGMSGADVAQVLGSPNVVTTDENGLEVWIYDKMATDKVYSEGSGGGSLIIIGGGQSAGSSSTSQRTLTVVIKFDKDKKVRDYAYHSSRF
jgi:outer membrane protein assembly factor BamE (lipoprotein component of BamABCDE complex)